MFIGVYLLISALVIGLGIWLLVMLADSRLPLYQSRRDTRAFFGRSVLLVGLFLLLFVGLSALTGLMRFGQATSWSYPHDYVAFGPLGWLIAVLPLCGVVSPLVVLWHIRRHRSVSTAM